MRSGKTCCVRNGDGPSGCRCAGRLETVCGRSARTCRRSERRVCCSASTAGTSSRCTGLSRKRARSEEHTSELQSQSKLVCRLLLEKKKISFCHLRYVLAFKVIHIQVRLACTLSAHPEPMSD